MGRSSNIVKLKVSSRELFKVKDMEASSSRKLRVGIFSLSSCEGCLVEILGIEDVFMDLLELIEVSDSRLLGVKEGEGNLDVAIVEGAVITSEDRSKLEKIRRKSKILVALGDCACYGGKFIMKDFDGKEVNSQPLENFVKVDYRIYGCPATRENFVKFMKHMLISRSFEEPSINVCGECLLRGAECLLEKGILCLGPITRAGCNALCPSVNSPCIGCRGLSMDANLKAFLEILEKKGISIPPYLAKLAEKTCKEER